MFSIFKTLCNSISAQEKPDLKRKSPSLVDENTTLHKQIKYETEEYTLPQDNIAKSPIEMSNKRITRYASQMKSNVHHENSNSGAVNSIQNNQHKQTSQNLTNGRVHPSSSISNTANPSSSQSQDSSLPTKNSKLEPNLANQSPKSPKNETISSNLSSQAVARSTHDSSKIQNLQNSASSASGANTDNNKNQVNSLNMNFNYETNEITSITSCVYINGIKFSGELKPCLGN